VYPRKGRFRPRNYQRSSPWQAISETFVEQTERENALPNYLDWIRGTYHADVPISDGLCDEEIDEVEVRLTVSLDFTKDREECIHWTIDLTGINIINTPHDDNAVGKEEDGEGREYATAAAYPGVHSGFLMIRNASSFNNFCEVIWQTPILSPYIKMESQWRGNDRAAFKPVKMTSMPESWMDDLLSEAGHREGVYFGKHKCYVAVLQEVLKDIARLLVFGPRYEDMRLPPIAPYVAIGCPVRDDATPSFFESEHFANAAAFFSRAFCWPPRALSALRSSLFPTAATNDNNINGGDGGREDEEEKGRKQMEEEEERGKKDDDTIKDEPSSHLDLDQQAVSPQRCLKTIETVEAILEHYEIVAEPVWLSTAHDDADWLDDLRADAAALRTVGEWRKFETKWAVITSYACGLNLHEGPWAGEDWACYVD
jgi:hypothetical protein